MRTMRFSPVLFGSMLVVAATTSGPPTLADTPTSFENDTYITSFRPGTGDADPSSHSINPGLAAAPSIGAVSKTVRIARGSMLGVASSCELSDVNGHSTARLVQLA